ncbi:MAG: acyltransferase [Rudaea sp.]|uniref:acyltransferase family protein n=1 Tax=unclassified Rudaea TaxID=2627037 RepID=UPI0010F8E53C|nr:MULTISPECIES: acyltransferase [unclassified Rudaea]MBN8884413.1 acyltransferase [Rudaea sp.]MBR0344407.1 acyltransferase [Rudaea sp.]
MGGVERVEYANTLRGIAAVCVLISHYAGVFWKRPEAVAALLHIPAAQVTMPGYLAWLHPSSHLDWGPFGVGVFFLVSGFVIPFSLRNASCPAFLIGRFFRIVPLYAAGFSISLAALWIVGRYFGVEWPFGFKEVLVHYIPGIRDLLWSTNIDGVIWTLEIEMKFYLVCAAAIVWFRRKSPLVFVVPAVLAVIGLYVAGQLQFWQASAPAAYRFGLGLTHAIPYLVFMFIGTLFHFLHTRSLRAELALFIGTSLFAMFAWLLMTGVFSGEATLLWSYVLATLLFGFAASFPRCFRATRLGNFFADISYPLYAIHGVAGYVALRLLLDAGVATWASLAVTTAAALALAWLLHVAIEVPSDRLGKRLARRLQFGAAAPDAASEPAIHGQAG